MVPNAQYFLCVTYINQALWHLWSSCNHRSLKSIIVVIFWRNHPLLHKLHTKNTPYLCIGTEIFPDLKQKIKMKHTFCVSIKYQFKKKSENEPGKFIHIISLRAYKSVLAHKVRTLDCQLSGLLLRPSCCHRTQWAPITHSSLPIQQFNCE